MGSIWPKWTLPLEHPMCQPTIETTIQLGGPVAVRRLVPI